VQGYPYAQSKDWQFRRHAQNSGLREDPFKKPNCNNRAGAIGPLPVQGRDGSTVQLLKIASIFVLEDMLRESNIDPKPLWFSPDDWVDFGEPLEHWIQNTAAALAQAVVAAASIIDFASVIIDGGFPNWVRARITAATRKALDLHDLQGVVVPEILEGAVGSQARAIGGASLPLFSRYLLDQNVLFKETAGFAEQNNARVSQ